MDDRRFMEFRLGANFFALPLLSVQQVMRRPEMTQVPNMPPHFEGIMNLRGLVIGIMNVRRRLGMKVSSDAAAGQEVVVVIEQNGIHVGIMVDEVTRVIHPDADKMLPAPLKEDDPAHVYVQGVIQTEKDLVMIVKLTPLLELDKYKVHKQAA